MLYVTVGQMMWLTVGALVLGALVSGIIVLLLANNHHYKELATTRSELDSLRMQLDIEQVTVTSHDAVTDNFVRTARFGTDLYAALAYCSQHAATYNLYLKVRRKSGEYIALNLINS